MPARSSILALAFVAYITVVPVASGQTLIFEEGFELGDTGTWSQTCPRPALYFESSWESGTGKSDHAVMDSGKWNNRVADGGIEYIEVISQLETPQGTIAPVDGNNMLSIGANGSDYENIEVDEFIREDDEHTFLRFYMLVLEPSEPAANLHGIQDLFCDPDGVGSVNFYVMHFAIGENIHTGAPEDSWYTGFVFRSNESQSSLDYFDNGHTMWGDNWESTLSMWPDPIGQGGLDFYRWYRFEVHIHWMEEKTSSTPALYYLRVFDDTGALVVNQDNLFSDNYDGHWQPDVRSLAELYSEGDDENGRRIFINGSHRCLMFGTNGFGSANEPRLYLVDKVAFSADGWIGK